jgi:cell division septation protein DedD
MVVSRVPPARKEGTPPDASPLLTPIAPRRGPAGVALALSVPAVAPASAAPAAASVTLTATPSVTVGAPVQASATILGATDVFSYSVTFSFDPAVIAYSTGSATAGPAGGFDAVSTAAASVTVLHSRLGTSPTIAGDLPVGVAFTTIASGDTSVTASVSLVDASGAATALPAATARIAVAALPAVPTASPTATPTPAPVPVPAGAEPARPAVTAPTAGRDADGSLAFTGLDSGVLVALTLLAIAALVAGLILVVRRRIVSAR